MKVLLRHRQMGLYYAGCQCWSSDPAEAINFEEVETAAEVSRGAVAPETEVVLGDSDPLCELALPATWQRPLSDFAARGGVEV
jgi:hypothetical protein